MNVLPKASGNRPRLACEISASGVVAARSAEPGAPLAAVARADLREGAVAPGLKPGNVADRVAVIAALRRVLEGVGARPNARNADLTLVIPDAAVRVLLLDFDALPNKLSEALPIVRFRLKKLLPFEADDAMISFQVMSTSKAAVRVLAVAMPRDVLTEYESLARETGFEPGAVLPSTLAALAALNEGEGAALMVNASTSGVTTAIVRGGIVLLHRTVELMERVAATPAELPSALFEHSAREGQGALLPLVDVEESMGEWAAQEALPEHGRDPYADRTATETAVEEEDGITGLPVPTPFALRREGVQFAATGAGRTRGGEPAPVSRSPYASSMASAELTAELHNSILIAPMSLGSYTESGAHEGLQQLAAFAAEDGQAPPVHTLAPDVQAEEIAQAVSVAVAYFEDSLGAAPQVVLSAGPLGADRLTRVLQEQGIALEDGLRVREMIDAAAVSAGAVSAAVPRGWLAAVTGALKS